MISESLVEEKVQPHSASSRFSWTALITLPLWARAIETPLRRERTGWALLSLLEPVVEYRVWPTARCPSRSPRSSSWKAWPTRPMAVLDLMRSPSPEAMPALSWPRC
jgi:hypothetical protein